MRVGQTFSPKINKISFIKLRELLLCVYVIDDRFLKIFGNPKLINQINEIRGGDWTVTAADSLTIFAMCQIMGVVDDFVLNHPNLNHGYRVDRPNPYKYPRFYDSVFPSKKPSSSTLQVDRPTSMPNQKFVDLTPQQKRDWLHCYDKIIDVEGPSPLPIGFDQSQFKVADHGDIHGLLYTVKNNGGTKTNRSEDNTLSMMNSLEDMAYKLEVLWFDQDNVTYL